MNDLLKFHCDFGAGAVTHRETRLETGARRNAAPSIGTSTLKTHRRRGMTHVYAYIAGLFDGEGHIGIQDLQMRFVVTNADSAALKSIAAESGKGYVKLVMGRKRGNRGPSWQWLCFKRSELFPLIEEISPHVRIKSQQIHYALAAIQCMRANPILSFEKKQFLRECGRRISALNSRKRGVQRLMMIPDPDDPDIWKFL